MGAASSKPVSTASKKSATEDLTGPPGKDESSDVTLISNDGREFQVHLETISAKSPVFSAMFSDITHEKQDSIVRLTDVDGIVLAETLRYIYSDQVENLKEIRKQLMAVTHKYMIQGLIDMCVEDVKECLCVDNAVESFTLADLYQIEDLKNFTKDFIRNNVANIVKTHDFKNLKSSKPVLLEELYCDLASNWKV